MILRIRRKRRRRRKRSRKKKRKRRRKKKKKKKKKRLWWISMMKLIVKAFMQAKSKPLASIKTLIMLGGMPRRWKRLKSQNTIANVLKY